MITVVALCIVLATHGTVVFLVVSVVVIGPVETGFDASRLIESAFQSLAPEIGTTCEACNFLG